MSDIWSGVPRELYICCDTKQYGTTYERLCLHLVKEHGYESWVVTGRFQTELEGWHDRLHREENCNHAHDKPVRIVGYEIKDKHHD